MAVAKTDLKFYLTSYEATSAQSDISQSLGRYPSTTEFSPSALLTANLNLTASTIATDSILDYSYVLVGNELLNVNSTSVLSRGYAATSAGFHPVGVPVFGIRKPNLLSGSFSTDGKQYRCLAVTNTNETDTFYDLKFYVKKASRSDASVLKIAVEEPSTEVVISEATRGSTISLIDSDIAGSYDTDHFADCVLVIDDPDSDNFNLSRTVASYDGDSGTFTFTTAWPSAITAGTTYRVENAPAQRTTSGTISPSFGTTRVSSLSTADGVDNAIGINVSGGRESGDNLAPFETVYLWIERQIIEGETGTTFNRVIFTASYRTA